LIAPLGVTLTALTINLVAAGLKDLHRAFGEKGRNHETPMPPWRSAQTEVEWYIQELKKEKKLRGVA